jgi:predicted neuraminidase
MPLEPLARGFIYTDAPFPACHASTVAHPPQGRVCAWFGGTHEKHPDVGIWLSRQCASGDWSMPEQVAKTGPVAHWNPVLFCAPDGTLHLWFKVGARISFWQTYTIVSTDGGRTWSEPREAVRGDTLGGRGPVKNKPILLSEGALLAGASTEQGTWESFFDRSEDGGQTWKRTPNLDRAALGEKHGCIQPTLWESVPGTVHALIRSSCGYLPRTDSTDGGRTWSPLYDSGLPGNNSGIDLAKLSDGTLILAHNPVGQDWGARTPLRLSVSFDNGATWPEFLDIETEAGAEFSYPALIAEGREVFVTYTWKRERICFWHGRVV